MTEKPNETAINSSFEFEALKLAVNYRAAIIEEFADHLRGNLLEVGAGIGQNAVHVYNQSFHHLKGW